MHGFRPEERLSMASFEFSYSVLAGHHFIRPFYELSSTTDAHSAVVMFMAQTCQICHFRAKFVISVSSHVPTGLVQG